MTVATSAPVQSTQASPPIEPIYFPNGHNWHLHDKDIARRQPSAVESPKFPNLWQHSANWTVCALGVARISSLKQIVSGTGSTELHTYFPVSHAVQVEVPATSVYRPPIHDRQFGMPSSRANFPATQSVHSVACILDILPAGPGHRNAHLIAKANRKTYKRRRSIDQSGPRSDRDCILHISIRQRVLECCSPTQVDSPAAGAIEPVAQAVHASNPDNRPVIESQHSN